MADRRGGAAPLHRADPPAPPVRPRGRDARDGGRSRRPRRPCCAATSSSSSSTASTWPPPAPCSTPARWRPTTCGPCTSTSTPRRPVSSRRSGAGSAWPACPSTSSSAPDRRLGRAAIELVADATLDGDTECTVLLPRRSFARVWQRFLHDRTADKIAAVLAQVPHVSATIIPFSRRRTLRRSGRARTGGRCSGRAWRHDGDGAAPSDTEGRTGPADRGAARTVRADRPRSWRPTRRWPARRRDDAHRLGRAPPAGPGGRAGEVGAGAAAGGDLEPRVRAERRHRRPAPGVPGPAEDRRDRARRPPGGRGHGRVPGAAGRRCFNPSFELVPGSRPGSRRA